MKNSKPISTTLIMNIFKKIFHLKNHKQTQIILFANYNYLPVVQNWIVSAERVGIKNYVVICLDQKLYDHFRKKSIPVLLRPCDLNLEKLWIHRIKVIHELLEKGYNIIHTDADAVWMKDPIPYLNNINADLVFSQGTYWPRDIHEKWGFVLCCGFFFIKNKNDTRLFIQKLFERVKKDKDDQISCNRLLYELGTNWKYNEHKYTLEFNGTRFDAYEDILMGECGELEVALLPHAKFQRIAQSSEDIYVKHIISEKNSDDIMTVLEQNACLFI